jgi:hypothetical protein
MEIEEARDRMKLMALSKKRTEREIFLMAGA